MATECSIDDCTRQARCRGWCPRHYGNWRTYGDPVPRKDRPLAERLREIGWTVTAEGCWEWRGKRNENGYGIFNAVRLGFTNARAHRVVYHHFFGHPLRDDQVLRHTCDNPPCVNPHHLIPGTNADNMADMVERRRHWLHDRTTCGNGHDLTEPGSTKPWKNVKAACVKCIQIRTKRDNDRRREKKAAWYQANKSAAIPKAS